MSSSISLQYPHEPVHPEDGDGMFLKNIRTFKQHFIKKNPKEEHHLINQLS
jgi:hypothetical protein